jgi:hypothetical protein
MTAERDLDRGMTFAGNLEVRTADRLLSGRVAPGDAPPGYAPIAQAVQQVMASPRAVDPAREAATLASVVRVLRSNSHLQAPARRRSLRTRVLTVKAAAIGATMMFGVTAAAAATDTLPAAVQRAVSDAASHVGVSIPEPHQHPNSNAGGSHGTDGTATGPDATGRAKYGLCTAYTHGPTATNPNSNKNGSVAFVNLQKAAADAGMSVADYCKSATEPGGGNSTATTGPGETPTTPTSTSNGSEPPASTPGDTTSNTTPGDTAPGQNTDKTTPGDTAPGHNTDKTTPGDTAPGHNTDKTTPGDTAPGKLKHTDGTTLGDTAPGKLEHKP